MAEVKQLCDLRGLKHHELVESQTGFEFLGMTGTPEGVISIKLVRRARLYQAVRYARRRRYMNSHQLECLVGQFTSQALLRRETLIRFRGFNPLEVQEGGPRIAAVEGFSVDAELCHIAWGGHSSTLVG